MTRGFAARLQALNDIVLRRAFLFVGFPFLGVITAVYGALGWHWRHADWGPGHAAAVANHGYHQTGTIIFGLAVSAGICLIAAGWGRLRERRYWLAAALAVALVGALVVVAGRADGLGPNFICACNMR